MSRLLLLCLLVVLAGGDELVLASGEVIDGEIVGESADEVRMRIVQGGMSAERVWPRSAITRIARGESPRQRELAGLRSEAAALSGDAGGWSALAMRARSLGDGAQARAWAERACALDRNQAEAQRLLGRELANGVWMRPAEAAAARGVVWEDGRWMTWGERERLRREAHERGERLRAELAAAAERRRAVAAQQNAEFDWPVRVTIPDTHVIWWDGWQPHPFNNRPILRVAGNGGWGGLSWNVDLNW